MVLKPIFQPVAAAPAWELIAPLPSDLEMDDHFVSPSPSPSLDIHPLFFLWHTEERSDGFSVNKVKLRYICLLTLALSQLSQMASAFSSHKLASVSTPAK